MDRQGILTLVSAVVLSCGLWQLPRAQSAAASQPHDLGTSVESAASIIGPLDAMFAKCKAIDSDRLTQYQEAEQLALGAPRADELRSVRASGVYAAVLNKATQRINELDHTRIMKSCESLLAQAIRVRATRRSS